MKVGEGTGLKRLLSSVGVNGGGVGATGGDVVQHPFQGLLPNPLESLLLQQGKAKKPGRGTKRPRKDSLPKKVRNFALKFYSQK